MNPDRFDHIYLEAVQAQDRASVDEYMGSPPQNPEEEKGTIRKFLEGVTKGMRSVPNVLRPPSPGETDIAARVGEAVTLPFTIPFEGLMQGLEDAGLIKPDTRKNITSSLLGALPAMIGGAGPRPTIAEATTGANMALKGGERGAVRIKPGGTPPEPKPGEPAAAPAPIEPATSLVEPPTGEVRVNLARIDATESVKNVIANVNALNSERLAASRKRVTHAETEAASQALPVEEALSLPEDAATLAPRATALRDLHTASGQNLEELAKRVVSGDAQATQDFLSSFAVTGELDVKTETAKRGIARGLESLKIPAEAARSQFSPGDIARIAELIQGAEPDAVVLAQRLLALRPDQRTGFPGRVATAAKSGVSITADTLYEIWINGLLSNPITHAVNSLSNQLFSLWAIPERAVASIMPGGPPGGIGTFSFSNREIGIGEAAALAHGYVQGTLDAVRLGKALDVPSGSKVESQPAISGVRYGIADTPLGNAIDWIGSAVRFPSWALQAEDTVSKVINKRMEVEALAAREARAEGLTWGTPEFAERARFIENNIEQFPSLLKAADEFTLVQTFQDPAGPVTQALMDLRSNTPGGRVVLPFLRTPSRLLAQASQRIPGVNLPSIFWGQLGDDIAAGGARRQLALAKVSAGAAITATVASFATAGYISGGGPSDKNLLREKKDTGWQPYSIKFGNEWLAYNRTDPWGTMLGTVADAVEIMGQIPELQAEELAATVVLSMSRNMVSKTYMQGLSDVLDAVSDPERGAKKYTNALTKSLVPGLVRNIERQVDPLVRDAKTKIDIIKASTPGYSTDLPPRRNIFGEPILVPEGWGPNWLSPIAQSSMKDDPVAKEIERNQVGLTMPPRVIFGSRPPDMQMQPERAKEGVELTLQEYDYLVRLAGNELKGPNGKGMKDTLAELFQTKTYQEATPGPDGDKAYMIRQVVNAYREGAKAKLLEEDVALRELVIGRIKTRAEALSPGSTANDILSTLGR